MAKFRDLSQSNSDLSDRSIGDRLSHQESLREALANNLPVIIKELDIFQDDPASKRKIKIPIKLLEEPKLTYSNNNGGVGQIMRNANSTGEIKVGTIIGKKGGDKSQPDGSKAGNQPGEMIIEIDPENLDFILSEISKDLTLPFLEPKNNRSIPVRKRSRWQGLKETGVDSRFDLEASYVEKVKRQKILENRAERLTETDPEESQNISIAVNEAPFPFTGDDLRYHGLNYKLDKQSNILLIFIMDISGSMDDNKRYWVKSFMYALYCFVMEKYANLPRNIFIAHHTEAVLTDADSFFKLSNNGGTRISSGLLKALEVIRDYPREVWDICLIHCSDGENEENDNIDTVNAFMNLVKICNLVGFLEVKPGVDKASPIGEQLAGSIKENHFRHLVISKKSDVGPKFNDFLDPLFQNQSGE